MTPSDVRQVTAFGKRIARCVVAMADLMTEVLPLLPLEVLGRVLIRLAAINKDMGDATDAWTVAAVPTEELDDA